MGELEQECQSLAIEPEAIESVAMVGLGLELCKQEPLAPWLLELSKLGPGKQEPGMQEPGMQEPGTSEQQQLVLGKRELGTSEQQQLEQQQRERRHCEAETAAD